MLRACFQAFILLIGPCMAEENPSCQMAVAALSLPADSDGLVHWRVGNTETTPLQLSTRYFSERVKIPVGVVGFYNAPVAKDAPEPPKPFLSLTIPDGADLAFMVLWSVQDKTGKDTWQGNILRGDDWKDGSLRLFNSTQEALGLLCGEQRTQLKASSSIDFHAKDWKEAFPVKVFRLKPEMRPVFSSKWRVTAGRRELCFITKKGDSVTFKSLIDLAMPPEEPEG